MTNFQQFFILGVGFNYAEMIKNVTLLYGPQIDSSQHYNYKEGERPGDSEDAFYKDTKYYDYQIINHRHDGDPRPSNSIS